MSDNHPELDGYEPFEPKPQRGKRKRLILQLVVLAAVTALVLPGVLTTASVASRNGEQSCVYRTALAAPNSSGYDSRFEIFGPGGLGFECYAVDYYGEEHHIASMGLIPVAPSLMRPRTPSSNS